MARRSSAIAFRFRRLYIAQIPYSCSAKDAYYRAEDIWHRQYGHTCYRNYISFANAMSRFARIEKLKI